MTCSGGSRSRRRWDGVGTPHLGPRVVCGEHPLDAGAGLVARSLPRADLLLEFCPIADPPIQALPAQHADFDLNHVQPTRVFGREMKFELLSQSPCLGWLE